MDSILLIRATIESVSPLSINGQDGLLTDNEGRAYMPATTIAGSFRAYLESIGEETGDLFGDKGESSSQSRIYIRDAFADNKGYETRPRVKINNEMGSSEDKGKFDEIFFKKGLKFNLEFKIESSRDMDNTGKVQIYKALKALDSSLIRIGGNKSNGIGGFKLLDAEEIKYDLKDKKHWLKYLRNDISNASNIKEKILELDNPKDYVEFNLVGEFITPLLIGDIEFLDSDKVDSMSIKSDEDYIIPGSSFKGVLRARIDKISDLFNENNINCEMFGEKINYKDVENSNFLSRVFVNECVISQENSSIYNRINIDKFTGGVRKTGLMNDMAVQGSTEFKVIYRKQNSREKDNYAIGIIALALRDLGNGDLTLGGGFSIGRGRFKASCMSIKEGKEKIEIDFSGRKISNKAKLDVYIKSISSFDEEASYER